MAKLLDFHSLNVASSLLSFICITDGVGKGIQSILVVWTRTVPWVTRRHPS